MEPTASPLMSLMPLAAATPDGALRLENPQNMATNGVLPATEAPGLFASILNQLTPDEPMPAPLVPETSVVLPIATPDIAAEVLPLTGNVLPVPDPPVTLAVEMQPVELDSEIPADTLDQANLLPLTEPAQTAQMPIIATTVAAGQTAAAAPVVAALATSPAPARPVAQPAADIARTAVLEPVPGDEPVQAPTIVRPAQELPVERLDNAINRALTSQQPAPSAQTAQLVATDGAPAPASAGPAAPPPAAPPATSQPTFSLERPIGDARWGESLGQRIVWMSENGTGRAEIRLNPPELGPLQVRVAVANDEAKVAFNVQHGTTREMVEAALPRLREMFASQGIELTDASVSQHSPGDRRQTADMGDSRGRSNYGNAQGDTPFDDADEIAGRTILRDSLIDTYV